MKVPIVYSIFYAISVGADIAVGTLGVIRYKKIAFPLRYLVWLMLISIFVSINERLLSLLHFQNNLWLIHCYSFVWTFIIALIFYYWRSSRRNGIILIFFFIFFAIVWVVGKFSFEPMNRGDDITSSVSNIFVLIFSINLMLRMLHEENVEWKNDHRFWVVCGFIVYSAGTFFLLLFFNLMLKVSPTMLMAIYPTNWVLSVVVDYLYARALLCKQQAKE